MRKAAILALLVLISAIVCGLVVGPAEAKDYSIDDVAVDAVVRPNGDLAVRESRTLRFSGDFTYVYWDLETEGSAGIEVRGASGPSGTYVLSDRPWAKTPGTYSLAESGGTVKVMLFFRVSDATATFSVDYVARAAAKRWDDTAELYWQFVGDDTSLPCGRVRVRVTLPDGVTRPQVRAWAHGPLWGEVGIADNGHVVLSVDDLPAYTFVESRLLFPAAALSEARPTVGLRVATVLAEEARWAEEANSARRWLRIKLALWTILGVGPVAATLVLIVVLYLRYGREPKARFRAEYLRDLPEPALPPALAAFIWRMGDVANDDATATLLDLIDRGAISIERIVVPEKHLFGKDEKVTYELTVHRRELLDLLPYERQLAEFLFDDIAESSTLVLSDLKKLAKEKRTEYRSGVLAWRKAAKEEAKGRGYLVPEADRMAFVAAVAAFAAAVAAGAAAMLSQWYVYAAGVPVAIGLVFAARAVRRRSPEAAELHAMYHALARYMKDFGRLEEKPPDAVALWARFLVYAVVFGIGDEVIEALQVRAPEVVRDPAFATMGFMMMGSSGGEESPFKALDVSFSQAWSASTTSSSSSSGGGGGFSSGGGGGGGGGGFGAG